MKLFISSNNNFSKIVVQNRGLFHIVPKLTFVVKFQYINVFRSEDFCIWYPVFLLLTPFIHIFHHLVCFLCTVYVHTQIKSLSRKKLAKRFYLLRLRQQV